MSKNNDYTKNKLFESKIMRMYRFSNVLYKKNIPIIPKVITILIRIFFSAAIPYSCELKSGVQLKHGGLGVVIHDNAIVGKNTVIYQHVTIGGRENRGTPIIGDNVYIGAGACILGNIKVGDNARIGANAVVIDDVINDTTVVGIPAKNILK